MAEAQHMVKLKDEFASKGVQLIGISLDENMNQMVKVAREKGFTWPQYFDGKGWKNDIGTEWGVLGIPATFIIGPEGDVLWKGHPELIDKELDKALAEHPPRLLDAKQLADANAVIEKTQSLLKTGDWSGAIKNFVKLPADARGDFELRPKVEEVQKQFEDYAGKAMDDAEKMIDQKEFRPAIAKLRDVSRLVGLPAAAQASKKLSAVLAMPEAKAQLAAADRAEKDNERNARAADALTAAQKLQAAKKDAQAYAQFKSIASNFANTPAGATAAEEVARYEKDTAFVKRISGAAVEAKAKAALSVANSYKESGKTDLARQKFQAVIEQFPNTSYAETARKELKELN